MHDKDDHGEAAGAPSDKVDLVFPAYFLRRQDGIFVDLAQLPNPKELAKLWDRTIASGYFVTGLDPAALADVLYPEALGHADGPRSGLVRLGNRLVRLDGARLGLYRNLQVSDGRAVYLFERIFVNEDPDDPESPEVEEFLDADEFMAVLWTRGVRAGIDMAAVQAAILDGTTGRVEIAHETKPEPGSDATVRELWNGLRRNDRPRVLPDGRADLTQFSNRFPQVKEGVRLLAKVPPVAGTPGLALSGNLLAPPVPSNFELDTLAGPGTRVEKEDDEQYLVATQDGFVDIDAASNRISVNKSIVHRQGVSVRTTGDLSLMGDLYEEYGEVQEMRTVEGRSITAHANVYGNLVSSGGTVTVKRNLSGGSAINRDGGILVEGLAVSAWLHAPRGEIRIRRAEACVISGQRIVIEEAVACEIWGESVQVADARGCSIAGAEVAIDHAASRGGNDTMVYMVLPRTHDIDKELGRFKDECGKLDAADEAAHAQQARLSGDPDFARYSQLMAHVRSGDVVLKPEQKPALEALARRAAPTLKAMKSLSDAVAQRATRRGEIDAAVAELDEKRQARRTRIACRIEDIFPGVVVRTAAWDGEVALGALPAAQLKSALHGFSLRGEILHQLGSGRFEWRLAPFEGAPHHAEGPAST
ncbi:MAG: DUF342 domain-containing protein [Rhodocyclaceae bacterium]|nr:DUF342 domain-containing protein [Rhodocyclaceae bacterium]